jgi:hypothetical protein
MRAFLLPILLLFTHYLSFTQDTSKQELSSNFHLGIIYPLSSNGSNAPNITNKLSLHFIGGISAGEQAFCLSGFGHVTLGEASGMQISGFGNIIQGQLNGVATAGFGNITHQVNGMTYAGFGNIGNELKGFQFAGFGNVANKVQGMQSAGFINVGKQLDGLQTGGFMNISGDLSGAQVAGFMNISGNLKGAQLAGFMNIGDQVNGFQTAGFMNIAGKVKGVQLAGFLNIADSSDYPIGIINLIGNGHMHIQSSIDELGNIIFDFRSGGKLPYGFIGVGYNNTLFSRGRVVSNIGLGVQLKAGKIYTFRPEFQLLNVQSTVQEEQLFKSALRLLSDVHFGRIHFFLGPSVAYMYAKSDLPISAPSVILSNTDRFSHYLLLGFTAGISIRIKGA